MSRASPSSSTAGHRYNFRPAIETNFPSRCPPPRRLRAHGPKSTRVNRREMRHPSTDRLKDTVIPRSAIRFPTSLKPRVKRKYKQTACWIRPVETDNRGNSVLSLPKATGCQDEWPPKLAICGMPTARVVHLSGGPGWRASNPPHRFCDDGSGYWRYLAISRPCASAKACNDENRKSTAGCLPGAIVAPQPPWS